MRAATRYQPSSSTGGSLFSSQLSAVSRHIVLKIVSNAAIQPKYNMSISLRCPIGGMLVGPSITVRELHEREILCPACVEDIDRHQHLRGCDMMDLCNYRQSMKSHTINGARGMRQAQPMAVPIDRFC